MDHRKALINGPEFCWTNTIFLSEQGLPFKPWQTFNHNQVGLFHTLSPTQASLKRNRVSWSADSSGQRHCVACLILSWFDFESNYSNSYHSSTSFKKLDCFAESSSGPKFNCIPSLTPSHPHDPTHTRLHSHYIIRRNVVRAYQISAPLLGPQNSSQSNATWNWFCCSIVQVLQSQYLT